MATQGDTLLKKTQRGFSVLAFETTKQSRMLKKRMRIAALQKEIKADLRDLGSLIYNAMINQQPGILEEEEVKILVQNVKNNKGEVERLRDSIGRLGRAKKHFTEEPVEEERFGPGPRPDDEPAVIVEAGPVPEEPVREEAVETEKGEPAASDAPEPAQPEPEEGGRKKSSVPPAPGADLEAGATGGAAPGKEKPAP